MKKIPSLIISLLMIVSSVFLIVQLLISNLLPTKLLILITAIVVLITLIFLILLLKKTGLGLKIFISLMSLILAFVYAFGGYYMLKTNSTLEKITDVSGKEKNVVSVIVKKSSSLENVKDLDGKKVGKLTSLDTYGTKKSLDDISENNVTINTTDYDSILAEVEGLYNGDVDAIILNESNRDNVEDVETYENFSDETKVIHQTTYYTNKVSTTKAVADITNTPFTILISGSDSRGGIEELSRSDVNMLVTVNPNTGTILLTSIPRDYYVETVCDTTQNCPAGQMDKLTHTGNYGVSSTKETIEKALGIEINYTVRVGFDAVERVVDALDGIDVTVESGYAVDSFWTDDAGVCSGVTEGVNHLNGTCALAFARERHAYEEGDRQRAKNQQEVIKAIANKALSFSSVTNYTALLDAVTGYFETDLTSEEIQSLIQWEINTGTKWKFEQYSVDGTGDWGYSAAMGQDLYMMYPDEKTVAVAQAKIKAVLNGESSDSITVDTLYPDQDNTTEVNSEWAGY